MFQVRQLFCNLRRLPGFIQESSKTNLKVNKPKFTSCFSTTETSPQEKEKELEPVVDQTKTSSIPTGILGQATCFSHSHLIKPGELTCGITQAEYQDRRASLMKRLISEHSDAQMNRVVIIPGASKQYMTDKIPYPFRQNSDFFYLTGCLEPSACLVMIKEASEKNFKSILFCQDKDSHDEMWEGPRTGCMDAVKLFAVDEAHPIESFSAFINRQAVSLRPFVFWYDSESSGNKNVETAVRTALDNDKTVCSSDPKKHIHSLRLIKSPAEIELMREACNIGSQAINTAMACTVPETTESLISAVLEFSARRGGAEHLAFPPVVAGGPRATHIHYVSNNQILKAEDTVLVDAGAQRWLYNSDISRTWPVSGKFNDNQKVVYEVLLTVQKRLLTILREQRPSLDHLFEIMCRLLGVHLKEAGVIPKYIDGSELIGRAYRMCPHHVSHYLGLDIHDTGSIKRDMPLKANMVVTVEPGIYLSPDDKTIPEEFRGIGMRIEDDVLIQEDGIEILTSKCLKEVEDIESAVGKHGGL